MATSARAFLDTNLLVYLFDGDAPAKQSAMQQLVAARGSGGDLVISTQVLQEFFVAVTRKLAVPLGTEQARDVVADLSTWPLVQVDVDIALRAIDLHRAHQLSFWDGLIVCAAQAGGCHELLSEDLQEGRAFGSLVVKNPLLP